MKITKNGFFLLIAAFLSLFACNKAEQIPAYLDIGFFTVDEPEGAALHNFREAYVFINNEFRGAYSLPAKVPVLEEGETLVELLPGILENGILNTPSDYELMNSYQTTVNLVPAQTVSINPSTKYKANTVVPLGGVENFESNSPIPFDDLDGDPNSFLTVTNVGGAFNNYMNLAVDTSSPRNGVVMRQFMEGLPITGGQRIWLEMNYKNNVPFNLILVGAEKQAPEVKFPMNVYSFNTNSGWNKIYINLTEFVTAEPHSLYGIGFLAYLQEDINGNYTTTSGSVAIDNIKVIHF